MEVLGIFGIVQVDGAFGRAGALLVVQVDVTQEVGIFWVGGVILVHVQQFGFDSFDIVFETGFQTVFVVLEEVLRSRGDQFDVLEVLGVRCPRVNLTTGRWIAGIDLGIIMCVQQGTNNLPNFDELGEQSSYLFTQLILGLRQPFSANFLKQTGSHQERQVGRMGSPTKIVDLASHIHRVGMMEEVDVKVATTPEGLLV